MATSSRPTATSRNGIIALAVVVVFSALLLRPAELLPGEYIGYALRVTAWIAFSFFIIAYVARPIQQTFGGTGWLVAHRRYFGLAAAFAHLVHFGYVVTYLRTTTQVTDLATLLGGGLAFALFAFMAVTSNAASMRLLGKWWKRIHRFGMHYIWFVFALTFSGGLGTSWISTLFFVDCVLALMLRIWAWWRSSRTHNKRSTVT